jgi:undecaprenyl pyrophosphate synthase
MNKSAEKLIKPNVIIEDQNLNAAGFIQSGKRRFKEVVVAFSDDLFLKSVKYSDAGARKIRKSADSLARKNITNLNIYRNMVNNWEQKKQKTNNQFDAENDDSFLKIGKEIFFKKNPKQKEWLDKINLELQKLNIYTYENSL